MLIFFGSLKAPNKVAEDVREGPEMNEYVKE